MESVHVWADQGAVCSTDDEQAAGRRRLRPECPSGGGPSRPPGRSNHSWKRRPKSTGRTRWSCMLQRVRAIPWLHLSRPRADRQRRFVACPFQVGRMYRVAWPTQKWIPDGRRLSRVDDQVKVRFPCRKASGIQDRPRPQRKAVSAGGDRSLGGTMQRRTEAGWSAYICPDGRVDVTQLRTFLADRHSLVSPRCGAGLCCLSVDGSWTRPLPPGLPAQRRA